MLLKTKIKRSRGSSEHRVPKNNNLCKSMKASIDVKPNSPVTISERVR